jgi:hypothetical protein
MNLCSATRISCRPRLTSFPQQADASGQSFENSDPKGTSCCVPIIPVGNSVSFDKFQGYHKRILARGNIEVHPHPPSCLGGTKRCAGTTSSPYFYLYQTASLWSRRKCQISQRKAKNIGASSFFFSLRPYPTLLIGIVWHLLTAQRAIVFKLRFGRIQP